MQEQLQTLTLEEAFAHELAKDVKLKGGGTAIDPDTGQPLMERSFKELGAGRSILLDRNGNIIAGNKSQQAAIAAGIKMVRVIETTGDEIVAVRRRDRGASHRAQAQGVLGEDGSWRT